jgi:hypothetical protein
VQKTKAAVLKSKTVPMQGVALPAVRFHLTFTLAETPALCKQIPRGKLTGQGAFVSAVKPLSCNKV